MALTEENFGVLERWSPAGGARTWRFDCKPLPATSLGWLQRRLSVTFTVTGRGAISLLLPPKPDINSLVKFVSNSTTDLPSSLRS